MHRSSTSSELSARAQATNAVVSGGWCPGAPQAGGWLLPAAANGALPPGAGDGALAGRGDGGLALAPLEGEAAPRRLRPLAIGEAGLGGVALGESLVMDSMCRAKGGVPRPALPPSPSRLILS